MTQFKLPLTNVQNKHLQQFKNNRIFTRNTLCCKIKKSDLLNFKLDF